MLFRATFATLRPVTAETDQPSRDARLSMVYGEEDGAAATAIVRPLGAMGREAVAAPITHQHPVLKNSENAKGAFRRAETKCSASIVVSHWNHYDHRIRDFAGLFLFKELTAFSFRGFLALRRSGRRIPAPAAREVISQDRLRGCSRLGVGERFRFVATSGKKPVTGPAPLVAAPWLGQVLDIRISALTQSDRIADIPVGGKFLF